MRRLMLALVVMLAGCGGAAGTPSPVPTAPSVAPASIAPTASLVPTATETATAPPTQALPTPSAAPVAPTKPVVLTGSGTKNTRPFTLAGGDYTVTWSATARSGMGCYHAAQLVLAADPSSGKDIGSALTEDDKTYSDETNLYGLERGRYYVAANSGCNWKIAIAPLQ